MWPVAIHQVRTDDVGDVIQRHAPVEDVAPAPVREERGRRPSGASRVAFAAAAKRAMILDVVGHLIQKRRPGLRLALLLDARAPECADERRRPRHERRAH